MSNKCCGGRAAIAFLESLLNIIPKETQGEAFRDQFDVSMNRVRYEIGKGIGIKLPMYSTFVKKCGTFYKCGRYGHGQLNSGWRILVIYGHIYAFVCHEGTRFSENTRKTLNNIVFQGII